MAQAATAPNFSNLLNVSMSDVRRPPPFPVGSYIAQVFGLPRKDVSSKKQTPFVEYTLNLIDVAKDANGDTDVDMEALAEIGGLQGKTIKATYYLTENALFMLKEFLISCGLPEDMNMEEAVEAAGGKVVGIYIVHEPWQSGEGVTAKVGKTFVVE